MHANLFCVLTSAVLRILPVLLMTRVPRSFMLNRERAVDYLNSRPHVYVFDGFVGWDPAVSCFFAGMSVQQDYVVSALCCMVCS